MVFYTYILFMMGSMGDTGKTRTPLRNATLKRKRAQGLAEAAPTGAWRCILAPGCSSSGQLTQDSDWATPYTVKRASQVAQWSRTHLTMQEAWVQSLGLRKISWRKKWQPTLVFLPGESPWTENSGGLWSKGLQRVGHNLETKTTS